MKKWFFLFMLLSSTAYGMNITEVMYNPADGIEWIEIQADKINFSDLTLTDNYATDELSCCGTCVNKSYYLISASNISDICVDDKSIGNGLGNSKDSIRIMQGNHTMAAMNYSFSVEKGHTLSFFGNVWKESFPTPLEANRPFIPEEFDVSFLPEMLYTGFEYKLLRIDNNFPQKTNLTFYYNISGGTEKRNELEFTYYTTKAAVHTFDSPGNYTLCYILRNQSSCFLFSVIDSSSVSCNISLDIKSDILFDSQIKFRHTLSDGSFPYDIKYRVEDIYGEEVKKERVTKNLNQKTFTPKTGGGFIIRSQLQAYCNNSGEPYAERLVAVRMPEDPYLEIEAPKTVTDGESILVTLKAYRGSSAGDEIQVSLGQQKARINLGKYESVQLDIPFLVDFGCDSSGTYEIVAKGFKQSSKKIKVTSPPCKKTVRKNYDLLSYRRNITGISTAIVRLDAEDAVNYSIWSYIYRGSKSYSGNRTANLQEIQLETNSSMTVMLDNAVDAPTGEYKLKVKILKHGLKTPYEITKDIQVNASNEPKVQEVEPEVKLEPAVTARVVHESKKEKSRNLIPIFLLVTGVLVLAAKKLV